MVLVTGGAGFIGSNLALDWLADDQHGAPTWARTSANATAHIIAKSYIESAILVEPQTLSGICHLTTQGQTSDISPPKDRQAGMDLPMESWLAPSWQKLPFSPPYRVRDTHLRLSDRQIRDCAMTS